jgi:hypothetical protein
MKNEQSLPQNYEGFSTMELLKTWQAIPKRKHTDPVSPEDKLTAMDHLLKEHRLAPIHWRDHAGDKTDMVRSKALLKPFGIDPAPWADQEGNRLPKEQQTAST